MVPFKTFWRSRQVRFNAVLAVIFVLHKMFTLQVVLYFMDYLNSKTGIQLSPEELMVAISATGNTWLRLITQSPIAWSKRDACVKVARYLDLFGFKWRDVKQTQATVNTIVSRDFKKWL